MRFGVREICNVVLRAKATQTLGSRKFYKNEPVLYFDTLKTSSLEGASTTVYATGGHGNTRLVAWEGERTLTFTMEDALISPEGFAILSGAGLVPVSGGQPIYVHTTSQVEVKEANQIELPEVPCWNKYADNSDYYNAHADIFVMTMTDGQIDSEPCVPLTVTHDGKTATLTCYGHAGQIDKGDVVLVDYYVKRTGGAQMIEITADKFGGNYYLEASTLFRRESDGVDMPAEFIIPNCKVQSNFTFSMASSGDPSTFTFTMDAFPDYTKFDRTHKVLAAIQVIEDPVEEEGLDYREPCAMGGITVTPVDSKVTIAYDNNSTEDFVKITASGNVIENNYSKDLFGDLTDKNSMATQVNLTFAPTLRADGKYRVIQTNQALLTFYPEGGDGIVGKTKTKTYDGADLTGDEAYGLLLGEKQGTVKVELQEAIVDGDTVVGGNTLQIIQITNRVNFKK